MQIKKKFRKGAASFYIVAFSTLILLIVATSFATVIISEITRTSNDDLSQSAYDSALAGVEDAKLAYYSYQNCIAQGATAGNHREDGNLTCDDVVYYMEDPIGMQDCDMVGRILGRIGELEGKEVVVQESNTGTSNNMQQAYTCAKIQTVLKDYRSTLSGATQMKVVKVKFDDVPSDKITKMKISWYADEDSSKYAYTNFLANKVSFPQVGLQQTAIPPTISVALIQTTNPFNLSDFDVTIYGNGERCPTSATGDCTDRGMVYLVPTEGAKSGDNVTYKASTWNNAEQTNYIGAEAFLKSNDKTATNLPYTVNCPKNADTEFACSATMNLPKPVGGARNDDTFMFVVALPYGKPNTDFAMEFFCDDACATDTIITTNDDGEEVVTPTQTNQVSLDGVQIKVDSTGKANDLFRRVEVRLESEANSSYLSIMGPLELLGESGSANLLDKDYDVKKEWNF